MKNLIENFGALLAVLFLVLCFVGCDANVSSKVTFETNGGQAVEARMVKILETAPITSRSGYVFAGWYLDQVMVTPAVFPLTVTEDMTVYAKWIKSVYKVTFDTKGGSYVASCETDRISEPPKTSREGYAFEGWYKDSTLKVPVGFPLTVTEDMTLYAKWKQVDYKVMFNTNEGSPVTIRNTGLILTAPKTIRYGYAFEGWYKDSTWNIPVSFPLTVTENMTLHAKWTKLVYRVSFNTNGGSYVESLETDKISTAPSTFKDGYILEGWYKDSALNIPVSFPLTVTENMTLHAKWTKIVYRVSFNTNGGSYVEGLETDNISTAPSTFKNGYIFEGWYKDSTLNVPVSFPLTVTENMTLYAKWLKIKDSVKYSGCDIKAIDRSFYGSKNYYVTPNGFDMNTLATRGYQMKITVTYDVWYSKDYDVLLDVGYAGSPKYEVSLLDSDGIGKNQTKLGTTKQMTTRTISIQSSISDFINERIILNFSTDNIQNIVHFDNIVVTYECIR